MWHPVPCLLRHILTRCDSDVVQFRSWRRRNGGCSERHTGAAETFIPLKVSRKCPLVLLVRVRLTQHKTLGSEVDSALAVDFWEYTAEERTWAFGLSLVFGGQRYDKSLITLGRLLLGKCFEVNFRWATWEERGATWIFEAWNLSK